MKIFSADKGTPTKSAAPSEKLKIHRNKVAISDSDIREKLAANTEISSAAKLKSIKSTQKLGEGFMKSDDHLLKSDVQLNNPEDPVTSEKLKSVLTTGAFNFSSKERDVLAKILE